MKASLPPCCYDDMLAYLSSSSSSLLIFLIIINGSWLIVLLIIIFITIIIIWLFCCCCWCFSEFFRLYMSLFFSVRGSQLLWRVHHPTSSPGLFPYVRRLYCHNLHSTKWYKPMWVLNGVPIIALMQLLTYLFDLFRFYTIATTLTVSNAHKKPQAKRTLVC